MKLEGEHNFYFTMYTTPLFYYFTKYFSLIICTLSSDIYIYISIVFARFCTYYYLTQRYSNTREVDEFIVHRSLSCLVTVILFISCLSRSLIVHGLECPRFYSTEIAFN